jgi:general secretion pathway protein A
MYEAFYGLAEKPFNLTPDPRFLFLSEKHKEAFAHLLFGIKNRTGFVMVSGEIGTGKTTICRSLLNQLDTDTEVAFIFNPCLSPEELLRKINEDFGIESRAETIKDLIDELNQYLLDRNTFGKNCVLVIDEAQDLTPSVLEQIRLLSNLETETQKLLQIVLIGQPELAYNLQLPELRQLNQRITARYHLKELDSEETLQYIAYRLRVAGGRKKVYLTRAAVRAVYRSSGGTPRVINAVCDRALLIGYTKDTHTITARIVRQAAKEVRGETIRRKRSVLEFSKRFLPNPSIFTTAALILILAVYLVPLLNPYRREEPPAAAIQRDDAVSRAQVSGFGSRVSGLRLDESPRQDPRADEAAAAAKAQKEPDTSEPGRGASSAQVSSKAQIASIDRLNDVSPDAARNAAVAAILRTWNKALISGYPENDSLASFRQCARANGLDTEPLSPRVDELIGIRLPAAVRLKVGGHALWAALLGADGDKLRITTSGNQTILLATDQFKAAYAGEAVIFWQDPAPNAPALKMQMTGPEVKKLQQDLCALDLLSDVTGVYDEKTRRAVAKIQAETGLLIDGVAGRQVRMVLRGRLASASASSSGSRVSGPAPGIADASLPVESALQTGNLEPETQKPKPETRNPIPEDNPLPSLLLSPLDASLDASGQYDAGILGPMSRGEIRVEDLPPLHDDELGPAKMETSKEVTPSAVVGTPLVPAEAVEGSGDPKPETRNPKRETEAKPSG